MAATIFSDAEEELGFSKNIYLAKKKAERNSLFEMLDKGTIETVESGENYLNYLDIQSRLINFSASNTILIQMQCPEASILKSYNEWAADNIDIVKGERAIAVLEPVDYIKNDGTNGHAFNVKKIFDVSQTYNGVRADAPSTKQDPFNILVSLRRSSVSEVICKNNISYPDLDAYYDNKERKIYVNNKHYCDITFCQQLIMALAHDELSMSTEIYSKNDEALNAAAVAYMFCRKQGIDTKGLAAERVIEELKGKEPKEIRQVLSRQKNAFREINSRYEVQLLMLREKKEKNKEHER